MTYYVVIFEDHSEDYDETTVLLVTQSEREVRECFNDAKDDVDKIAEDRDYDATDEDSTAYCRYKNCWYGEGHVSVTIHIFRKGE